MARPSPSTASTMPSRSPIPRAYNFGTADFTIELWAKRNGLGGAQRHLFSKCHSTLWQSGCKELYFNPSNQLTFGSYATGDTVASTIADTNWHHIAVTFTDSTNTLQIYVDGTLVTTATKALEADGAGHVVTLGNLFEQQSVQRAARRSPPLQPRAHPRRDSGRGVEYGEDWPLPYRCRGRRRFFPSRGRGGLNLSRWRPFLTTQIL